MADNPQRSVCEHGVVFGRDGGCQSCAVPNPPKRPDGVCTCGSPTKPIWRPDISHLSARWWKCESCGREFSERHPTRIGPMLPPKRPSEARLDAGLRELAEFARAELPEPYRAMLLNRLDLVGMEPVPDPQQARCEECGLADGKHDQWCEQALRERLARAEHEATQALNAVSDCAANHFTREAVESREAALREERDALMARESGSVGLGYYRATKAALDEARERVAELEGALKRVLAEIEWEEGQCPTCSSDGPEESHDASCPLSRARSALNQQEGSE